MADYQPCIHRPLEHLIVDEPKHHREEHSQRLKQEEHRGDRQRSFDPCPQPDT